MSALATQDGLRIIGHFKAELLDEEGNVVDVRELENLIVTTGRNAITDQLLASPTLNKPTHMAIGTGTTAEALGQTALVTESARVALTSKTRANNVLTLVGDFGATVGTGSVTEAGVFDAASTGNMHSRVTFAAINKGASDTLKITWTWTIG